MRKLFFPVFILLCGFFLASFIRGANTASKFPYRQAGLTEREAAAHLLNRFTYGPKAGDIDLVVKIGLEKWVKQQLSAEIFDAELDKRLSSYEAINLSNNEAIRKFPQASDVFKLAVADGFINKDSVNKSEKKAYRGQLEAYMAQNGLKPQQELFRQFISQKVLRAAYTNNQLEEVLTDFWFNHFNVSLNKNQCAPYIPGYERDIIRPNVLGKFEALLLATAKSPAMLRYLDNFSSTGEKENLGKPGLSKINNVRTKGLNENYAREVMELHTLGVDGGYTQQDVTEAARVLTGWTINPMTYNILDTRIKSLPNINQANSMKSGSVRDGDFYFAANRHDKREKVVLGKKFEAGGGYEEGVELLTMLANAPATAKFISRKIAIRFVSDNPPQSLIDKMAKTFSQTNGDIKEVMLTMAVSPEFWSKEALREKTKSPFELAISAVRALNADIKMPLQLNNWITKMGQKIYYYQAPTGFPDKGQYWINTGSLLNRMNFGLALATQKIPGVKMDLAALNNNHEPESPRAALIIYSKLIMPERDLSQTIKRLTPVLNDPNLENKVQVAAARTTPQMEMNSMVDEDDVIVNTKVNRKPANGDDKIYNNSQSYGSNNSMLAQAVGVIIGSPEFQRK